MLGQHLRVFTDHKNLTCKNFNTDRVIRWRLVLEEYSPELIYVPGESNVVADALSRLPLSDINPISDPLLNNAFVAGANKLNSLEEIPQDAFPLTYKIIASEQQKDQSLLQAAKNSSSYAIKTFHGGGKSRSIITLDNKIVLPASLQQRAVSWCHSALCHPGETRTEQTIRQHFTFKGLREMVHQTCSKCDICQRTKKNYGHLPPKQAESSPWEVLCVDLIGPYTFRTSKNKK